VSDEFVDIVAVEALPPGSTMQYSVDGTPLVIASTGEAVFALHGQCTHAGGPLGGSRLLRDSEVECPLHGACFDVRTGKVCKGPAREPLPTYEARVLDGMIQVRVPRA
jgi:nitrite reductase/ring-hydroxylating ferredoxin subunit